MFLAGLCWSVWLVCLVELGLCYQVGSLLFSGVIFPFSSCVKIDWFIFYSISFLFLSLQTLATFLLGVGSSLF